MIKDCADILTNVFVYLGVTRITSYFIESPLTEAIIGFIAICALTTFRNFAYRRDYESENSD